VERLSVQILNEPQQFGTFRPENLVYMVLEPLIAVLPNISFIYWTKNKAFSVQKMNETPSAPKYASERYGRVHE
jgi:hypothetical protein